MGDFLVGSTDTLKNRLRGPSTLQFIVVRSISYTGSFTSHHAIRAKTRS